MPHLALVLSGGGARGAYQAGVLAAISHIASRLKIRDPFRIYTGVSAGAINVSLLVAHPGDFVESAARLANLWGHLNSDQVFYADLMALSRGGLQWMTELSLGSSVKQQSLRSLLSTQPLHGLLKEACRFDQIQKKIQEGRLRGVNIAALDYESISTVNFFEGSADVSEWARGMHRSERAQLGVEHVMGSSAIPLLFPPIKVGERYFGDGCIRNQSPCAPAIYMGAEKLIAIGVRRRQETSFTYLHRREGGVPTVARVANVLMNAVMMDGLEADVQRIEQINQSYSQLTKQERERVSLRDVQCLWISPSVDFSELASKKSGELPRIVRYLLRGPGAIEESSEMLSYLLFTPTFCKQLIDIGYSDGMKEKDQIEELISSQVDFVPKPYRENMQGLS